jgi:hypothetical protein
LNTTCTRTHGSTQQFTSIVLACRRGACGEDRCSTRAPRRGKGVERRGGGGVEYATALTLLEPVEHHVHEHAWQHTAVYEHRVGVSTGRVRREQVQHACAEAGEGRGAMGQGRGGVEYATALILLEPAEHHVHAHAWQHTAVYEHRVGGLMRWLGTWSVPLPSKAVVSKSRVTSVGRRTPRSDLGGQWQGQQRCRARGAPELSELKMVHRKYEKISGNITSPLFLFRLSPGISSSWLLYLL